MPLSQRQLRANKLFASVRGRVEHVRRSITTVQHHAHTNAHTTHPECSQQPSTQANAMVVNHDMFEGLSYNQLVELVISSDR